MKPKHLCISGGEPCLVPGFENILRQIREGVGDAIRLEINTNGILPGRLREILPYINTVCLSIDGVGDVNMAQRGYDGDKLLELLEELVAYKARPGQRYGILVVPVATEMSYRKLPELVKRVEEIWKHSSCNVSIDIKPIHPYDHPLSIANNAKVWKDFIELSSGMMNEFEIPVHVRGLEYSSGLNKQGVKPTSRCFRQYFAAIIKADGHVVECKPEKYYDYFKECYLNGTIAVKAITVMRALYALIINKYSSTCYFPCEHGQFIDDILLSKSETEMADRIGCAGLRISPDELHAACRFIKRHFNKALVMNSHPWRREAGRCGAAGCRRE